MMNETYNIISLQLQPQWRMTAACWFYRKWNIPMEEYLTSIDDCIQGNAPIPQWYLVVVGQNIVGGAGVIANDFHERKDLTPNICALYVEPEHRGRRLAGKLLAYICEDMRCRGLDVLYLVTEHVSFYEKYGWGFQCMVQGDDGEPMRMYYKYLY